MSKSVLTPIEEEVRKQLNRHFPGKKAPRFIIAVSGGPDSMCLLYIFRKLGIEALVVHINYQKRGLESDRDAELVEEMAFQWGFDCQSVSVDPGEAAGENFQQWARNIRYDIFRSLKQESRADGIALAHHEDDQVETILHKQFRGAGLANWRGMKVWDGELFRPLLSVSQAAIDRFVKKHSVPCRIDKSNLESDFARNFLRNEWLVALESHFPGWRKNVLRTASQADLFEGALEWISNKITGVGLGSPAVDREALVDMRPDLRKALILHQLKQWAPDIDIGVDALNQLDDLEALQTGKAIQLTQRILLLRDRNRFTFINTNVDSPGGINLELSKQELLKGPRRLEGMLFRMEPFSDPDYAETLYLDAAKITWPLTLRLWQKGDEFRPFGMRGHQKISDHLTNRKISAAEKSHAFVLETFEETICAVIFPPIEKRIPPGTISEHVRCGDSTSKCLTIKRIA